MTMFQYGYHASYNSETSVYQIGALGGSGGFTVSDQSGDSIASVGEAINIAGVFNAVNIRYVGTGSGGIIISGSGSFFFFGNSPDLADTPVTDFQAIPYDLAASTPIPCFLSGTMIRTERGEVAVETLIEGDLLHTRSGELKPLRWIGHRVVSDRLAQVSPGKSLPVRISAGALGDELPKRDLWLSADHCLYHDGVLVQAKTLLNGSSVIQAHPGRQIVYYHLLLETHDVIFAEGATAETYRPCNNTFGFQNAETFPDDIERNQPRSQGCFPVKRSGLKYEALRALLLANAPVAEATEHRAA